MAFDGVYPELVEGLPSSLFTLSATKGRRKAPFDFAPFDFAPLNFAQGRQGRLTEIFPKGWQV
jgi:hypothetical protein